MKLPTRKIRCPGTLAKFRGIRHTRDMTNTTVTPQSDYDRETEGMLAVLYARLAKIQKTGRDPWKS